MSILLVAPISLVFFLGIAYLLIQVNNKDAKAAKDRFILKTGHLIKGEFKDIRISYLVASGHKYYPSINNTADIYLFDDFLAIFRTQNFIIQVNLKPSFIGKDPTITKELLGFTCDKPDKTVFKTTTKGQIEIRLIDPKYQYYKTTITIKGLTDEQRKQFSGITDWAKS